MSGGQHGSGQIINPSAQDAVWARGWGAGERRWGSGAAEPTRVRGHTWPSPPPVACYKPPASGLLPFHQSCF